MDSRVLLGLVLFMESYLIVDLFEGDRKAGVSYVTILVVGPCFFFFLLFLYGIYHFPLAVISPGMVTTEMVAEWEQVILLTVVLAVLRRFLLCSKHHINIS